MTEKSSTRQTISSTTQTWESLDKLPPGPRAMVEKMLAGGKVDASSLGHEWGRGTAAEDTFVVKIDNGEITVNGRKYDSIDQVPQADRERVEAVRKGFDAGGLMDIFGDKGAQAAAGFAAAGRAADSDTAAGAQTATAATATAQAAHAHAAARAGADLPASFGASPGYVPPGSGARRLAQWLVAAAVVALLLLAARWQHVL
jgi:hypothetical protein